MKVGRRGDRWRRASNRPWISQIVGSNHVETKEAHTSMLLPCCRRAGSQCPDEDLSIGASAPCSRAAATNGLYPEAALNRRRDKAAAGGGTVGWRIELNHRLN